MHSLSHPVAVVPFGPTWAPFEPREGPEARCWRLLTLAAHLAAAAQNEGLSATHRHDALGMADTTLRGAWQAWRLWAEPFEGQDQGSADAVAVFQGSDDLSRATAALDRLRAELGPRLARPLARTAAPVLRAVAR